MKLIKQFGLAALLVAFLAVPALAQHHGGGTTHPSESSREPQAAPSPVPVPYPNVERPKTQTPSGVKGESTPQPTPSEATGKVHLQEITIKKTTDKSSSTMFK